MLRLSAWWRADILFRVNTNDRVVALTLDDGPDPVLTPLVLDSLARHHAKATFFLIGDRAAREPDLVQRIRREGHQVGNHLWEEQPTWRQSDAAFERSLDRSHAVLGGPHLFRPGSGLISRRKVRIAWTRGYRCVLGSIYSGDALLTPDLHLMVRMARCVRRGDIIIMHEGEASRLSVVRALDALLTELRQRQYGVVSVGDLEGCDADSRP